MPAPAHSWFISLPSSVYFPQHPGKTIERIRSGRGTSLRKCLLLRKKTSVTAVLFPEGTYPRRKQRAVRFQSEHLGKLNDELDIRALQFSTKRTSPKCFKFFPAHARHFRMRHHLIDQFDDLLHWTISPLILEFIPTIQFLIAYSIAMAAQRPFSFLYAHRRCSEY